VLKIIPNRNEKSFKLQLCGRLTEEYLPEIERLLAEEPIAPSTRSLDLADVTFVDRAAMLFILCARNRNVVVENCPSYVNRWIEQEDVAPKQKSRDNDLR
jgi:ABC-type transporter Mla MlaB component